MKTIPDLERLGGILSEITAASPANGMAVKIVAVDGHGGSGKSTLANQLAELLRAEIIHTDDFASWDNPLNWWPALIEKVLDPSKQGAKTLSYERSKSAPEHHPEPIKNQPVTPIMILEGVSSARKEFRPYLTYSVWVTAPKDVCLARCKERDSEHTIQQWEQGWADEEKYIQEHDPEKYADATVSSTPIPVGAPETLTYTKKQRIDFLANAIVDRIVEDQKNGAPLLKEITKANKKKRTKTDRT